MTDITLHKTKFIGSTMQELPPASNAYLISLVPRGDRAFAAPGL